ncbi:uncharacterized protein LOC128546177 [Mercenaria mercenaria]|uniref:uncharacterized protein LOC128546177 n=1 Tax=Mercenaria mercenaria TaxID=6596 RepID=UPI00234F5A41|nr:uncharacterized protein LOC128546177 [Mercenaria mercenaria]XP_053376368.1 uncharacterized protein LOC128546177 [Mercenaria mercenaria]XP_053376369.1 uncharacterized protein LOC128546177 [Mercenaria mercenaria]
MKQIILLILISHTNDALGQFFNETVTLPEAAKNEIEECYKIRVNQNVPAEDLWQVQLACLSEYYKNLNVNNITSDNMKPFMDAENNRFGFTAPPTGFRLRRDLRTLTEEEWIKTVNVFLQMYKLVSSALKSLRKKRKTNQGLASQLSYSGSFLALKPW